MDATLRFPPRPESVGRARHFVESFLADSGQRAGADVVVLLTSEVMTNAVTHAGPHDAATELSLRIGCSDGRIRVEMHDHSEAMPVIGDGTTDGLSGRGILLVESLAWAWGVSPSGAGKVVWFEV